MMKKVSFLILFAALLVWVAGDVALAVSEIAYSDVAVHYKFEETAGTTFADSSANAIAATYYRPLKYAELPGVDVSNVTEYFGAVNQSIGIGTRTIGSTDYQVMVDVPSSTSLPGTGDTFAVSFWANVADWTTTYGSIASYNLNGLEWSIGIHSSNDSLVAWSGDAGETGVAAYNASCASLTAGSYAHFVVQYSGDAGITGLYINGASAADTGDSSFWGNEHEGFTLGGRALDARNYTVPNNTPYLDDFALIDGTVDELDVSSLYTSGASSLGTRRLLHYEMEDSLGTQITDSSGNALHGTLIGYDPLSMGLDTRGVATASRAGGVFGNCVEIADGETSFNENAQLDPTKITSLPGDGEAFTVCFWLKPDENIANLYGWDTAGVVFNWANDTEGLGFSVGLDTRWNGSLLVRRTTGDYTSSDDQDCYNISLGADSGTTTGLNLDPDVFHHFAVTVDADGTITGIYVDGEYVASQYENGWGLTDEGTGVIGARIKTGVLDTSLCAYLDDLGVTKGVLTEAQIEMAMQYGFEYLYTDSPIPYIPGDATHNGTVDADDLAVLAAHWGMSSGALWSDGDFNDDGRVNAADAALLAANWQYGVTELGSEGGEVPEPSAFVALLGLASALLLKRKGQR